MYDPNRYDSYREVFYTPSGKSYRRRVYVPKPVKASKKRRENRDTDQAVLARAANAVLTAVLLLMAVGYLGSLL